MTQKYSRNSKMLSGAFNITCVTAHRHSFSRCPRQHLTAEQSLQSKSTFPQVQHTADGALLSLLAHLVLVLLLPASYAHTTGSFPPQTALPGCLSCRGSSKEIAPRGRLQQMPQEASLHFSPASGGGAAVGEGHTTALSLAGSFHPPVNHQTDV